MDLPPIPHSVVSCQFGLTYNTQAYTSPLSRATQTAVLAGARWEMTLTLRRMKATERAAGEWRAFFASLRGQAGRFNAYDFNQRTPLGNPTGTPLVMGATQTGNTVITDGWTASKSGLLLPGDYFGMGGKLKIVTAPVVSNGSGVATITFEPPNITGPADNSAIVLDRPTCVMMLADDGQATWSSGPTGVYEEKTFSAVEVLG